MIKAQSLLLSHEVVKNIYFIKTFSLSFVDSYNCSQNLLNAFKIRIDFTHLHKKKKNVFRNKINTPHEELVIMKKNVYYVNANKYFMYFGFNLV